MPLIIAIEQDAKDIGGSGTPIANKCLTKDKVSSFGDVKIIDSEVNNYTDKQLVAKAHLEGSEEPPVPVYNPGIYIFRNDKYYISGNLGYKLGNIVLKFAEPMSDNTYRKVTADSWSVSMDKESGYIYGNMLPDNKYGFDQSETKSATNLDTVTLYKTDYGKFIRFTVTAQYGGNTYSREIEYLDDRSNIFTDISVSKYNNWLRSFTDKYERVHQNEVPQGPGMPPIHERTYKWYDVCSLVLRLQFTDLPSSATVVDHDFKFNISLRSLTGSKSAELTKNTTGDIKVNSLIINRSNSGTDICGLWSNIKQILDSNGRNIIEGSTSLNLNPDSEHNVLDTYNSRGDEFKTLVTTSDLTFYRFEFTSGSSDTDFLKHESDYSEGGSFTPLPDGTIREGTLDSDNNPTDVGSFPNFKFLKFSHGLSQDSYIAWSNDSLYSLRYVVNSEIGHP